ncbi:MAG: DegT/DnrJ/EryC1/StrS family aminotransferase [Planctomycetota bacterium]
MSESPSTSTDAPPAVPAFDLRAQWAEIREEALTEVTRVLDAQACVNGPDIAELEQEVADYCRAGHGVGVTSGTDAILVALQALGVRCGQSVVTSPFTFFATAGSPWRVGVRPIFVDVEDDTLNLDPNRVEDALTDDTAGIMPVHLFGRAADMTALGDIAERKKLLVIEDAAQAIGAKHRGKRVGSFGHATALSFYPTKNLGGAGDGGMVLCQDADVAERARKIRNHGAEQRYFHEEVGGNFRLDTLQAAYLRVKLRKLETYHAKRRDHAAFYGQALGDLDGLTLPAPDAPGDFGVVNQYTVRTTDPKHRDALRDHLATAKVGTAIYYPLPLHQQACFASLGYKAGDFPVSERASATCLSLPIFPEMTDEQRSHVADAIRSYFA